MQVLQSNDHLQSVYTDDGCSDLIRTDLFNAGYRKDLRKFCSVKDKCIDLGNSSNWSSDRISSHSNEKFREIQGCCFNKVENVDTVSSFLTIPFVNRWSSGLP